MNPGGSPIPGSESPDELPSAVRARVIALADDALTAMDEDDVPASLRAIRRFTPAKRTRFGAPTIGAALESDPAFRAAVQARVRDGLPDLTAALDAGTAATRRTRGRRCSGGVLLAVADWPARVEAARRAAAAERPAG